MLYLSYMFLLQSSCAREYEEEAISDFDAFDSRAMCHWNWRAQSVCSLFNYIVTTDMNNAHLSYIRILLNGIYKLYALQYAAHPGPGFKAPTVRWNWHDLTDNLTVNSALRHLRADFYFALICFVLGLWMSIFAISNALYLLYSTRRVIFACILQLVHS